ncbi:MULTISPECIES: thioredoxin [Aerococcus]|uniref:Thioredoxin n=1 Tax=Aerococcus sanguinicola TaxID=119206 RepID=A0A5N1GU09_9LACT|nr:MULTISPECIES: thioredoxin [Aerococcus]KAA9302070.1 thioredoxin [Aerococcus sanguinicola]MDK6368505.1 thioredoxin [Aerococcus sp. UMB9870]MDK6679588.1 thioredoxin [Aerococcus sp. UMB8608]MDK6686432.1 thioredoxin [Aerococcus sp. UMB8623]MDK6940946.1 thioredoxin [Aerococcus sp. UMB8487]
MVQALNDANFEAETKEGLVLVDFWATWCGPCRMQSPVIEQLDDEMGDQVKFTKVDVDENQETARQFGIMSIPTLLIKKDGEAVETLIGYTPKEKLEQILEQYL